MSATPEQIADVLKQFGEVTGDRVATEAAALIRAQAERVRVLEEAGAFLVARLTDFEQDGDVLTDDGQRDWNGYVSPAVSRFRAALNATGAA